MARGQEAMRTLISSCVCLILLGVTGLVAEEPATPVVTVIWEDPDSYVDVRATLETQGRFEKRLFEALTAFIETEAAQILSPGRQLKVTVHNLDLAGYIEMNLLYAGEDTRVYRDSDRVMIEIEHQLLDASGAVLSEQRKRYTTQWRSLSSAMKQRGSFHYEKRLIRAWLRHLGSMRMGE